MSTAMERYQGVILIRLQNAGSKSEGHYAFLVPVTTTSCRSNGTK